MYRIRVNRTTNEMVVRNVQNNIALNHVGRRGPQGGKGDKGDKGDPGDPATNLVTSVNGKQGVVVLTATDVEADSLGSASNSLSQANNYTDEQIGNLATVASSGSYNDLSNKPTIPVLPSTIVQSIVAGANVTINNSDPSNPIVSSIGGGTWGSITGDLINQTDLQSELDRKADFPTVNSSIPARGELGAQTSVPYTTNASANTIVQRGNMGVINTGTPTADTHAATKLYVDMVEGKIQEHGMGVVVHGTNPSVVRPTGFAQITWVGSIKPLNALENDVWVSEVSS